MAVVWEFVIMTKHIITPEVIKRINEEYKNQAEINTISSIDDWCWSNQRKLDCISSIEQELSEGKIITVEMHSSIWKALGLYIERDNDIYTYTFWINTEGFPEIDVDEITEQNKKYYVSACSILEHLMEKYVIQFECIAIGLESEVQYSSDMVKMISESSGVVVWLINKDYDINLPREFMRVSISNRMDAVIKYVAH